MRDSIILPTKAATIAWASDLLSFAGKSFKCFSTRETNLKTPSEAFWRVLPPARHKEYLWNSVKVNPDRTPAVPEGSAQGRLATIICRLQSKCQYLDDHN